MIFIWNFYYSLLDDYVNYTFYMYYGYNYCYDYVDHVISLYVQMVMIIILMFYDLDVLFIFIDLV